MAHPQGFKHSSTIFNEILVKDLQGLHYSQGVLLKYIDDLLIASLDWELCINNTIMVLNHLA